MRKAIFRCAKNNRVLFLIEENDDLEFGAGYVARGLDVVEELRLKNMTRHLAPQDGYFERFISQYSRTMVKEV